MQFQLYQLLGDNLLVVSILFMLSFMLRITLSLVGQGWVNTTAHTITLIVLPIITYAVTKVISGDIALSLGMVGALSIVRFRNPVRSPLELSVYFCSIAMGITASVSLFWLLFLAASIISVISIITLFDKLCLHVFNRQFLTTSFSEGIQLPLLEVSASGQVDLLDRSLYLHSKYLSNGEVRYVLMSPDFEALKAIEGSIFGAEYVKEIRLSK